MERNSRDAKRSDTPRDATGSPRITYVPREDFTPEGELSALVEVYRFVLERHDEGKKCSRIESGGEEGGIAAERKRAEEILLGNRESQA